MITPKDIDQHGKVALWEATDDGPRQVLLVAVDAAHALEADPDRWSLTAPSESVPAEPTEDPPVSELGVENEL